MVDQLAAGQVEALYVILRGMVDRDQTTAARAGEAVPGPGVGAKHRFSFIGIMEGEPDLAERSAAILREELGKPAA